MDVVGVLNDILELNEKLKSLNNSLNRAKRAYLNSKRQLYESLIKKKIDILREQNINIQEVNEKNIKELIEKYKNKPLNRLNNRLFVNDLKLNSSKIPPPIRDELMEDFNEMLKCYDSKAYRCVVIICGRLMEIVLHRLYYEATGVDLLEKSPGIGLGKLIAKLAEKSINLDPGLTQQIHLINQVRIFSVHKKQEPFYPSEHQAKAIMLYTIDVINKVFSF